LKSYKILHFYLLRIKKISFVRLKKDRRYYQDRSKKKQLFWQKWHTIQALKWKINKQSFLYKENVIWAYQLYKVKFDISGKILNDLLDNNLNETKLALHGITTERALSNKSAKAPCHPLRTKLLPDCRAEVPWPTFPKRSSDTGATPSRKPSGPRPR